MPLSNFRVCISSSFSERLNRNLSIAESLAEGFADVIGRANVIVASIQTVVSSVAELKPDLVLLVGSCVPSPTNYEHVASACRKSGTVFAFWSVEDPYEIDASSKFTKFADVVFTNDMWARNYYAHPNVHHLPTAASPRVHRRALVPSISKSIDVLFCGVGFPGRQRLIMDAADVLARRRTLILGPNWPNLPFVREERVEPQLLGDLYAKTRAVLNLGRDFNLSNSRHSIAAVTPGPRTYEAAMAGCVQLYHLNSRALEAEFVVGEEILVFETVQELDERIAWVLSNPSEADRIAQRAQTRAIRDHTYTRRAEQILTVLGYGAELRGAPRVEFPVLEKDL